MVAVVVVAEVCPASGADSGGEIGIDPGGGSLAAVGSVVVEVLEATEDSGAD